MCIRDRNIRPPIRTEARRLENFYAAPEEEQYFLRKYPDTYSPIDIKLLEEAGTLEILTWNDMNWFALIMRSEQSFYHWQKLYRVISLGQPNRKTGAYKGLIGKIGAMPTRSRHCNAEQVWWKSLRNWEDRTSDEAESGELPVWNHRLTHERWEGDLI